MAFQIKTGKNKGKWKEVIYISKNPITGKWKTKDVYGDGEKEVKQKAVAIKYELQNNIYRDPGKATLKELFEKWHDNISDLEETTIEYYGQILKRHIYPNIGDWKLKDLKPMDLDSFYKDIKDNKTYTIGKNGKTQYRYSSNTIQRIHSVIHAALEYAKINDMIKINPADFAKPPKKQKYTPKIMSEKEFRTLLENVRDTFDEVAILLAGCAGLRRSEVFGLRWEDINWENQTITIKEVIVRVSNWTTKRPKNDSSQRTIAVPKFVMNALEDYRKTHPNAMRVCEEYKPGSYSEHFKKLLEKLKLPHVRYHDLRHFNAIIMLKYKVPDKVSSERLGHSNVNTTREIYQHVLSEMDMDAARIINSVFDKNKSDTHTIN